MRWSTNWQFPGTFEWFINAYIIHLSITYSTSVTFEVPLSLLNITDKKPAANLIQEKSSDANRKAIITPIVKRKIYTLRKLTDIKYKDESSTDKHDEESTSSSVFEGEGEKTRAMLSRPGKEKVLSNEPQSRLDLGGTESRCSVL